MTEKYKVLYRLDDPRENGKVYIGCSSNPRKRYAEHVCNARYANENVRLWINDLKAYGLLPQMTIIEKVSLQEWKQAEKDVVSVIRSIRGKACLNGTACS